MIFKDNRQIKRFKKSFLKEIKPYEDIDEEIDKYVEIILKDPLVSDIALLGENPINGFAGFDLNDNIRYIWIFRNRRGNNLGAFYCDHYGVSNPTKKIMDGILKIKGINPEQHYIAYNRSTIWNIKYGFILTFAGPSIILSYDEYAQEKGGFKNLTAMLPGFIKLDFDRLEKYVVEILNNPADEVTLRDFDLEKIIK